MGESYAYLGAGATGKLKFPDEHAEWTRTLAQQGYARIAAENAAKAEKKAERERSKQEAKDGRARQKSSATSGEGSSKSGNESQLGDGTGIQRETKKSLFGFLRRSPKGEKETVVR